MISIKPIKNTLSQFQWAAAEEKRTWKQMGETLSQTKGYGLALASVAQWTECRPENQRVAGLIPSWDTCLGCRPGPQWGARVGQPHTDISLPLFLPPFPSLNINK